MSYFYQFLLSIASKVDMRYHRIMESLKLLVSSSPPLPKKEETKDVFSLCDQHGGGFTFTGTGHSFSTGFLTIFHDEDIEARFKLYLKEDDELIDHITTYCDWRTAGNDLSKAMKIYTEEHGTTYTKQ